MTYTSVGINLGDTKPSQCTWVVFLCTSEAFLGLLFAGMCAAILFGKVNRVQSHANIIFANAVCLQYEEIEDDDEGDGTDRDIQYSTPVPPLYDTVLAPDSVSHLEDEENQLQVKSPKTAAMRKLKAAVNTVSWGGRLLSNSYVQIRSHHR